MPYMMGGIDILPPGVGGEAMVLQCCPWWLMYYSPAIDEVSRLYGWRSAGCMDPSTLDLQTRRCVEGYANGIARGQHERTERERKTREHRAKQPAPGYRTR